MLKERDYEGLARHLQSLSSSAAAMRPSAYCENMAVNTLVAYHFEQAREKSIVCSSTLYVPEGLAIPTAELAVILGNALENAVKGAESMEEKGYIRFDAKPVKDCIVFDMENNYRPGAYPKGYGVGLSSIRELCEKNQGRAKVEDNEGVFKLNVVLRLSE
jgi:sensor histidine kinase regulating citrate/malate metabolism